MKLLSGLMFFPRGGSAHVARAMARALPLHGVDVTVLSGSRADEGDARRFYSGLDVHAVDFDAGDAPLHPSYEDRADAPDKLFAKVDDEGYERHVAVWCTALEEAGVADHDVLHLHHLTPLHEAAARVAPGVPVVGHLHGTELLMLEEIADGPPPGWNHAIAWRRRMRRWAQGCERLLLLSPSQLHRAVELLGVDPDRCVVSPNGFDPEVFAPQPAVRPADDPVRIAYVGRFTAVKRVPLLIEAWAQARSGFGTAAELVLLGGYPGEHEGEHPQAAIDRTGAQDVRCAGWVAHEELPARLAHADALVLPSVREQFGAVIVEAMACGLPVIAVDRFGPGEIVDDGRTGWLVEPDDRDGLARALHDCVTRPDERRRRGAAALEEARASFSWPAIAEELAELFVAVSEQSDALAASK